jgi:type I restriction enzyme S subunit
MQALRDLGDWHSGGTPPRGSGHYFEGDIPWFSSGELESMYVSDSSEHISESAVRETSAKLVPAGALMLGMYDTAALKSSIAMNACSCNQAIAFASIRSDRALTEYVYFAVQVGREDFRRLQRGVRQKNLNLSMVREIRIPAPTLALQQTFATRIQAIEALKATHHTALAQLDALFASLQQRAFAGEL